MPAPSIAVSQTFVYAATAGESHFSANIWYGTIVVTNGTSVALNVGTDGGTAVASASTHEIECAPGVTQVYENLLQMPNPNALLGAAAAYYNGVMGTFDQSEAVGWTAQRGYAGANFTFCSVIPQASATGNITIAFQ